MRVKLKNERTGEIKEIKIGWSWTLFLFSWFLGIPLFLRKLNVWGGAMLALCIFYWVLDAIPTPDDEWTEIDMLYVLVGGVMLGLQIYFGIKGNELSGKNMLENGWQFADPDDHMTTLAKEKWRIQ